MIKEIIKMRQSYKKVTRKLKISHNQNTCIISNTVNMWSKISKTFSVTMINKFKYLPKKLAKNVTLLTNNLMVMQLNNRKRRS